MNNKDSRGRYRDYTQRIVIKKVVENLIKNEKINSSMPIKLIIRIDQQATATDTNREFIKDVLFINYKDEPFLIHRVFRRIYCLIINLI